jgi:hypothetical protein
VVIRQRTVKHSAPVTVALGILALLVGSIVLVGQLISAIDYSLAQRLGLQESDEQTDPLHRRLELSTARWDLLVLWTLPLAGVAMLIDAHWWPWVALIAGGAYVDAGGREASKLLALRSEGVRIGTEHESRMGLGFLALMAALGLALIAHSLVVLI